MVSDDMTPAQPDPTHVYDKGVDLGPRGDSYFAPARLEIALCLTLVSTCPVCGEEHALVIPATETRDRIGWMNYRVSCAGPLGELAAPTDRADTQRLLFYRPPTHAYVTRVLFTTVERAIERDTPRRLWWPFASHDSER